MEDDTKLSSTACVFSSRWTKTPQGIVRIVGLVGVLACAALLQPSPLAATPAHPSYTTQPSDASILRSCARKKGRDAVSCIGLIADGCAEQPSDEPITIATMQCRAREQAAWDQLLNERYAELVTQAKERDAASGAYLDRESHVSLVAAQRAWIAFRDAELERFWMMRAPASAAWRAADLERLRLQMTAERYVDLLVIE